MTKDELAIYRLHNEKRRQLKKAIQSGWFWSEADREFDVAARKDPVEDEVDALLDEVERLQAESAAKSEEIAEADAWPEAKARTRLMQENQGLQTENKELSDLLWRAEREPAPCRHCGTLLSWHFLGEGTNYVEAATGKPHQCLSTDELVENGLRENARLEQHLYAVTAENERLREALRPFAEYADKVKGGHRDDAHACFYFLDLNPQPKITLRDCRRAREALGQSTPPP